MMPTIGQALQQTRRQAPPAGGPIIRAVTAATATTVDVGWGNIVNATGTTPAVGNRVVVQLCDESVWVATALLP